VGGKDRTGLLAALFSRLAGVPVPVADTDYRRSEPRLGVVDSAPAGVMETVLTGIDDEFGSVANYFSHVGAPESAVERLRARLRDTATAQGV
jgi:hypothetical protein